MPINTNTKLYSAITWTTEYESLHQHKTESYILCVIYMDTITTYHKAELPGFKVKPLRKGPTDSYLQPKTF